MIVGFALIWVAQLCWAETMPAGFYDGVDGLQDVQLKVPRRRNTLRAAGETLFRS